MVDAGTSKWMARRSGPTLSARRCRQILASTRSDTGSAAARSAGTVVETIRTQLEVAVPPLGRAATRDAHGASDMRGRGAGLDTPAKQQSTLWRERSDTVPQGDLRGVCEPSTAAHLPPEVFALVADSGDFVHAVRR